MRIGRLHILKRHGTGSNNWVVESSDNSNGEFDICDRSLLEVGELYEETEKKRGKKRNRWSSRSVDQ